MNDGAIFKGQYLALVRVVSALLAVAGLAAGAVLVVLPRAVRLSILHVLRPAESAARRLIVVAARSVDPATPRLRQAPVGVIPKGTGETAARFALFDPRKRFPELSARAGFATGYGPRISGIDAVRIDPALREKSDARLIARLRALRTALDDIPAQARRLARVLAKRRAAGEVPRRTLPLRPGFPPGHRQRRVHEVDDILAECDLLAARVA
jgi:hypothetical protein